MSDGPVIPLVGWPCGTLVSVQPCGLAAVAAADMTDEDWVAAITDPDATAAATEKMATSWRVSYADGAPVTAKRLGLAVVSANAAAGGPCQAECVRPCPVAEWVAAAEYLDGPILGDA